MALTGLVSSAAPDELRAARDRRSVASSARRSTISVPLSDDAELFVKGLVTDTDYETPDGTATPSAATGAVTDRVLGGRVRRRSSPRSRSRSPTRRAPSASRSRASRTCLPTRRPRSTEADAALAAARVNAPADVPTLEGRLAKLNADAASLTSQIETLSARGRGPRCALRRRRRSRAARRPASEPDGRDQWRRGQGDRDRQRSDRRRGDDPARLDRRSRARELAAHHLRDAESRPEARRPRAGLARPRSRPRARSTPASTGASSPPATAARRNSPASSARSSARPIRCW